MKLSMAQVRLNQRWRAALEVIGKNYFQNLATGPFFQDFEKYEDEDQMIYSYEMHDIVHVLPKLLHGMNVLVCRSAV
uniref:Putative disease resistance protein RGA3 n=1 Tax=Rhizophora mucronata TaxID=61149 RepID=A0A2P2LCG3_RHIMU